jgi:group I intron endonuclease
MDNNIYGIIYIITNLINGKQYVGQTTKTEKERFNTHVKASRLKKPTKLISKAIKKYKKESFKVEKIDSAKTKEELNIKEKYWIKKINTLMPNGYNMTEDGD